MTKSTWVRKKYLHGKEWSQSENKNNSDNFIKTAHLGNMQNLTNPNLLNKNPPTVKVTKANEICLDYNLGKLWAKLRCIALPCVSFCPFVSNRVDLYSNGYTCFHMYLFYPFAYVRVNE